MIDTLLSQGQRANVPRGTVRNGLSCCTMELTRRSGIGPRQVALFIDVNTILGRI